MRQPHFDYRQVEVAQLRILFQLCQCIFLCFYQSLMHGFKGFLVFWRQFLITIQAYIIAIAAIEYDGNKICVAIKIFPIGQISPVAHAVFGDDGLDGFQFLSGDNDLFGYPFTQGIVSSLLGQGFLENGLFTGKISVGFQFQAV